MPYRNYVDPTEQYQGTAFNPYTGRLDGAQLVMQFLARQKQGKEEADRVAWEKIARSLEQENAELGIKGKKLGIEQAEWEKAHRVDPKQKLMYENWIGAMGAEAQRQQRAKEAKQAHEYRMKEIGAREAITKKEQAQSKEMDLEAGIAEIKQRYDAARNEILSSAKEQADAVKKIQNPNLQRMAMADIERQKMAAMNELRTKQSLDTMKLYAKYPEVSGTREVLSEFKTKPTKSYDQRHRELTGEEPPMTTEGAPKTALELMAANPGMTTEELKDIVKYMQSHPEMTMREVYQYYQEWKAQKK